MTIKKAGSPERKIITNLIVNDRFCKEILPLCRKQYWKTSYAREVSSWVAEYYSQYEKAPGKDIQDIYHQKRPLIDDESQDEVEYYLKSISKEYVETEQPNNVDYEISTAVKFLKLRSLEVLSEAINDSILENNPSKGEQALSNFKRVEKPMGQGVDLLRDDGKIIEAFTMEHQNIISFNGEIGKVIAPIARGDFVSYFGPAARGKSFWLWYTAETAMAQGNKVIYFTLEMTKDEIIRRAWPSLTGSPKKSMEVHSAYFEENDDDKWEIIQKVEYKEGVDLESTKQLQKKLKRLFRKGNIKIICPEESFCPNDIVMTLDNLEHYDNFIPDVIVIDYLDYMIPNKDFKQVEYRHSLNSIWKSVRDISIHRNVAIVTASHTETTTFDTDVRINHASEDKRKLNHVTMAIGLNQTEKEASENIMRIGMLKLREGRRAFDQAVVLQCLDVGRPCIDSRLKHDCVIQQATEETEEKEKYGRKK